MKHFTRLLAALSAFSPWLVRGEYVLDEVVVSASADASDPAAPTLGALELGGSDLAAHRNTTSDSARLLQNIPGVSLYGAGGISSLPAIHGLADDRIRVEVDGVELMPACPNHMNSPLSYIDPTKVDSVRVFAGITPVSVGGDSIGGSIQVKSAPPEFAHDDGDLITKGHVGSFYRSNGNAHGYNFGATLAGQRLNLTYSESSARSDNFTAGRSFKPSTPGREGGSALPGDEVGSSAYHGATNRALGLALRHEAHVVQLELSRQLVDFEGFPNQRMDMTANDNRLANLRYTGQFAWGELEAGLGYQDTRHRMDMGADRFFYGTGMPMDTEAKTRSGEIVGNIFLTDDAILRTGVEYQYYTLFDWWPPVGGAMGPNTFWNVDYGQREKLDAFAEWENRWNDRWLSQVGVRSDTVVTDSGPVQGYDNGLAGVWGNDASAFNARDRRHSDANWDLAALARYTPGPRQSWEFGYARKSRSPNLYQRYPWATNPMAALMNNFVGDGNGYIGNADLKPEIANTLSITGDWYAAERDQWGVKATGYYSHVEDYIDARRCDFGQCGAANVTATTGFVLLQYVNQTARLYGLDLSGHLLLGKSATFGKVTGTGNLNYVRGENLTTGDNLYNIMPLNARLAVEQNLDEWTNSAEIKGVAGKRDISQVRNEIPTESYWLLNLRSSYDWGRARLDFDIENVFDRYYTNPLGGAYVGQGASMTSNGIPWGVAVPGMGRSFNLSLNLFF